MNWNKKGYCDVSHTAANTVQTKLNNQKWQNNQWYNNRKACETAGFRWYEISHNDMLVMPNNSFVCARTQFARVNQLGNAMPDTVISQSAPLQGGVAINHIKENLNANRFMWTIPTIPVARNGSLYFSNMQQAYKSCVLRLRYNVSSADFQQWPKDAVDAGSARMVDYRNNSRGTTDPNTPLHQNPYVYLGPGDSPSKGDMFVKLKVNTNQYSRTFQDRSYVFSIKPLPTASADVSNMDDTPAVDYPTIIDNIKNGGKIYNVNVRGKRGNIVQVYPSVEYDFVPNALALGTNDMVHFQWTGSDYNPRRGCNDATGGPPDLNTYSTDANANQNPRADRSNVVLTYHMGYNVPMDYIGYSPTDTSLSYSQKLKMANSTVLKHAFCYDPAKDSQAVAHQCYQTMMRLAYLNQQSDSGSLVLRAGKKCLTEAELNAINNQDVADFHPLNCAKLNAKPYPYFDGGVTFMRKQGWFPYYSSRNNNFSNRQQIAVICVGTNCKVDNTTGVLQDKNPQTNGNSLVRNSVSTCVDTAGGQPNANGVSSCLKNATVTSSVKILTTETFSIQEGDNDAKGDGNPKGCSVLSFSNTSGNSVEQNVALAFILLAVGIVATWLAYYLYNRYQARREGESKFRYDTAWQKATPVEKRVGAPVPAVAGDDNAGVKLSRPMKVEMTGPASSPTKPGAHSKIKRTEMI